MDEFGAQHTFKTCVFLVVVSEMRNNTHFKILFYIHSFFGLITEPFSSLCMAGNWVSIAIYNFVSITKTLALIIIAFAKDEILGSTIALWFNFSGRLQNCPLNSVNIMPCRVRVETQN